MSHGTAWFGPVRHPAGPNRAPTGSTWNGSAPEAPPKLVEDLRGPGGADPVAADLGALDHRVKCPDASGRLEFDVRRRRAAHQAKIIERGPAGPIAGRGLDVVGPDLAADPAEADLLLVVQIAVLEDHLDERTAVVGRIGHGLDVGGYRIPLARD